jgi:hypothetical protein
MQPGIANLNAEQLTKLQKLEQELNAIVVAYVK